MERLSRLRLRRPPEGFHWIVWTNAPAPAPRQLTLGTVPRYQMTPPGEDPVCFKVEKGNHPGNAFALGITLGRADTNDVPIDHASVSRFHAWFQQEQKSKIWHVVDAESFNGTSVDGIFLSPSRPAPLRDGCELTVGDVKLRYFHPLTFEALRARP